MSPRGPRFLDEQADRTDEPRKKPDLALSTDTAANPVTSLDDRVSLPRGPVLLEPEAEAPDRVHVDWMPEVLAAPETPRGTGTWIAAGLGVIAIGWVVFSVFAFIMGLLALSVTLGIAAATVVGLGTVMLLYACLLEIRAYRSLANVERLRWVMTSSTTTLEGARHHGLAWLHQVAALIHDRAAVERLLRGAATVSEIRGVLRSQVADRLRETANGIGTRAAIEGATLVGICPHPAWDGIVAGVRGLLVIRRVAALYGVRPGLAVTLSLVRQVAWTAASTAGLDLVAQGVADKMLHDLPILKHVVGALPGSGVVAVRLYRLAGVTAEACSPMRSR